MTSLIGRTLSHYKVLGEISRGGMGIVYRALDVNLNREVALKVLPAELLSDASRRRRFVQEARAAASLEHPHIAAVYEIDEADGETFIAMELIRGERLQDLIAHDRLPPARALELAVEVAEGLSRAHEKGIVHRDVKPANIMVTEDGHAKIIDFGLAKLLEAPAHAGDATDAETHTALRPESEAGLIVGTISYMSPEQARGDTVDHRSDTFALGVVLYEMLTGAPPFRGPTRADILHAILHAPAPPLEPGGAGGSEIQRIVDGCLAKDPEARYQATRDVVVDLRAARLRLESASLAAPLPAMAHRRRSLPWLLGVAAGAAALAVIAVNVGGRLTPSSQRIQSLAVLPLQNLSGDPEQEYLADGMTEALIADLGQIRALRVISRTSAMHYKGTRKSLPEIAEELKVDGVVEGSVLTSGGRVRIMARLVQGSTDRPVWSDRYDRDLKDTLALQSEVARAIAHEIKIAVTPQEQARLAKAPAADPEAHQLYLKGRYHWNKRTREGFEKALIWFQQAIDKDPAYAPAYAGLADTYGLLGLTGYDVLPPREAMAKAKAAAGRALEIDETLAEAHALLAAVRWSYEWDWPAAEKDFARAIELNPGYATAHQWYSWYLSVLQRSDEALVEAKRALDLDPLSLIINANVADAHYYARRFEEAIEQYRKTLDMDPNFPMARLCLGMAMTEKGRYREAIVEYEKLASLTGGSTMALALMGNAHARSGDRRLALRILDELGAASRQRDVPAYQFAIVHMGLGDKDRAFAWLEKAYAERSEALVYLKVHPLYDPLRSDPRFGDLVRRVGLPEG